MPTFFLAIIYKYCVRMWPDWLRHGEESDEDTGDNSDTQRRKRRTGERSVFDRFIGEAVIIIILIVNLVVVIVWPTFARILKSKVMCRWSLL